ncbi:MAG: ArsR/SmtB family transcription factor [Ilumatobacteraceae bacterium]
MHADIENFVKPPSGAVEEMADRLRLVGDPTRLRLLFALAQGESNVACLAELADANASAVSQHLAKLRLAGVVRSQREGQQVFYELVDDEVRALVEHLLGGFSAPSSAGRTRARASK